ncbi:DUF4956 domain-containing protein [Microbacterium proteolyticum]|uniref:DUF4956 domain-containing protein n=1 Tax=Microbacterium proteolyticum TaxID=1572644 RepID=UPI001FACEBED|nr:DUF4956 domain-containing protein [Microbacterium proteolyticum]MCI9859158.1 DUF4956 domain-containing protein [Microbacterium proteolyticum]
MTTTALILAATDLVAAVLLSAIYFQRHRRRDLVVAFLGVNVGVLAVATVLGTAEVALGLGLGLFGVLSIIRLRSSEITQREVAYYFAALAIGLICGLPPVDLSIPLLLVGLIVAVLAVADHPRVLSRARHQIVHLDRAIADETELRAELERLLGGEVTGVTVQQLDLVDDTTLVDVRYRVSGARPDAAPGGVRDIADAAPGPRRSAEPPFADLIGGTR